MKTTDKTEWGRSGKSNRVHLFVNNKRQCINGPGMAKPPVDVFPDWDSEDPDTCQKCRERHKWLLKGAVPASQKPQPSQHTQKTRTP